MPGCLASLSMVIALMLAQMNPIHGFTSRSLMLSHQPQGTAAVSCTRHGRPCGSKTLGLSATVEDDTSSSSSSSSSTWHSDPSSPLYCSVASDDVLSYWETIGTIATISSPWLTIYCERLRDDEQELLDYWRVETEHSAVIVTLHRNKLVLPKPQYRPGVGCVTLDFPGGRIPANVTTLEAMQQTVVPRIVQRELGIPTSGTTTPTEASEFLSHVQPVSGPAGWIINSSFSNQRLYGFVATLRDDVELPADCLHVKSYDPTNRADMQALMQHDLLCLQCRHVLLEYMASCW